VISLSQAEPGPAFAGKTKLPLKMEALLAQIKITPALKQAVLTELAVLAGTHPDQCARKVEKFTAEFTAFGRLPATYEHIQIYYTHTATARDLPISGLPSSIFNRAILTLFPHPDVQRLEFDNRWALSFLLVLSARDIDAIRSTLRHQVIPLLRDLQDAEVTRQHLRHQLDELSELQHAPHHHD
jgi:hypothetical protein